jgi:hypothetical protein
MRTACSISAMANDPSFHLRDASYTHHLRASLQDYAASDVEPSAVRAPPDGAIGGLCVVALAMGSPWPPSVIERVMHGFKTPRSDHAGSVPSHVFAVIGGGNMTYGAREAAAAAVRGQCAKVHALLLPPASDIPVWVQTLVSRACPRPPWRSISA